MEKTTVFIFSGVPLPTVPPPFWPASHLGKLLAPECQHSHCRCYCVHCHWGPPPPPPVGFVVLLIVIVIVFIVIEVPPSPPVGFPSSPPCGLGAAGRPKNFH